MKSSRLVVSRRVEVPFVAERLERRALLAVVDWVGGIAGNWNDPANWSGGLVPGAEDEVRILATDGQIAVTLDGGAHTIKHLQAESVELNVGGDSLTLTDGGTLQGTLRLTAGTLTTGGGDGVKLELAPLTLFEMSGGVLRGDLELSALGALRWTGGEMALPGTTTVGVQADPQSFIDGRTSTPVLSRPLIYRGRDLAIRGNLVMEGGSLDFDAGPYFLVLDEATILNGTGTNLLRTTSGSINVRGETRLHVPVDVEGLVGLGRDGILHLLSTGNVTFEVGPDSELHVGGDGYALAVNSVGLTSRGEIYVHAGTHTVGSFEHEGDVLVEGQTTHVTFTQDATAATFRVADGAHVDFERAAQVEMLRLSSGSRARLSGDSSQSLLATSLLMVGGSSLDLGKGSFIIDYDAVSPLFTVRSLLVSGYAEGQWTGPGIGSSHAAARAGHAVGYAEAASIFSTFPADFAGIPVDDTAVILTHTLYGDTNLDRTVNLLDFNRLAANFGSAGAKHWSDGDFNFDDRVNLTDFNRLAAQFGRSVEEEELVSAEN